MAFVNPLKNKVLKTTGALASESSPETFVVTTVPPVSSPPSAHQPQPMLGTVPIRKGSKTYIVTARTPECMDWHGIFSIKDSGKNRIEQVCEVPLVINSLIFDINTNGQAIELSFLPAGRKQWVHQIWDKSQLVTGNIASFCWKRLIQQGVSISAGQLPKLQEYIRYVSDILPVTGTIPSVRGTDRTGWVEGEYVAAGYKTKQAPVFIGLSQPENGAWETRGDKKEYMEVMRLLVKENPFFALVAGYYLSGFALSRFGGSENFILCLLGDSTLGKTLAAKFCIAMKGRPNVFATFDSTEGSLKSMMMQHNDGCMVIDEVGTSAMTDRQKARFVYDVSSGKNRSRLSRTGDKYNAEYSKAFKYTLLLTGEESLLNGRVAGGQKVRYTEIVFDRHNQKLWESISSGTEADDYLRFFETNHGWLAPMAIEQLRANMQKYIDAYQSALHLFANKEDAKASRKHKLFAGAYSGMLLLNDCLCLDFPKEQYEALLTDLVSHADRDMDEHSNTQYYTALSSTMLRFKDYLYTEVDGISEAPYRQPVMGKYIIEDNSHVFIIDKEQADYWASRLNVDLSRFLTWAEKEEVLQTYPAAGRKYPKRFSRFKIGEGRVLCYKFRFTVERSATEDSEDAPF